VLLLFLIALTHYSCTKNEQAWFPVTGAGELKTETRHPGMFTNIKYLIKGNVTIVKGDATEVRVSAQENLLPLLETEVANGTLFISFGSHAVVTDSLVSVQITVPEVRELTFSGNGQVNSQQPISSINLAGNGNITCSGETDQVLVKLSGSGLVNLDKMVTRKAQVKITGNGNVSLNVTDQLDVAIQGLGIVYYSGMPQVQQNITGMGQVIEKK
jgi:hypothetical protein